MSRRDSISFFPAAASTFFRVVVQLRHGDRLALAAAAADHFLPSLKTATRGGPSSVRGISVAALALFVLSVGLRVSIAIAVAALIMAMTLSAFSLVGRFQVGSSVGFVDRLWH